MTVRMGAIECSQLCSDGDPDFWQTHRHEWASACSVWPQVIPARYTHRIPSTNTIRIARQPQKPPILKPSSDRVLESFEGSPSPT